MYKVKSLPSFFQEDHENALKPPGGALFWRNAGKYHLANYELKPKTATDGN
jgi:hypothetical protein